MGYLQEVLIFISLFSLVAASAESPIEPGSCGPDVGGKLCEPGYCCSKWGFCGITDDYCDPENCQSQCPSPTPPPPPPPPPDCGLPFPGVAISCIVTPTIYELLVPELNNCPLERFYYNHNQFITASKLYPQFGNTGDIDTRKREIAAFLAHTTVESSSFCYDEEAKACQVDYCVESEKWPCAKGRKYYGRGPFLNHMRTNIRYGQLSEVVNLGAILLEYPQWVSESLYFQSAMWIWNNRLDSMPASFHDIMVGNWTPSPTDIEAGWLPGFGLTTNILSPSHCGSPGIVLPEVRAVIYKKFCDILGVEDYGDNLTCENQAPLHATPLLDTK